MGSHALFVSDVGVAVLMTVSLFLMRRSEFAPAPGIDLGTGNPGEAQGRKRVKPGTAPVTAAA
ncbi:hypothetical protein D3C75_1372210 [compost metagenome]